MDAQRKNQMWMIGGMLAIILVVVAGWFLLISPKFAEVDEVHVQSDSAAIQLAKLRKEVGELKELEKQKATFEARLRQSRTALPEGYDVTAFLRTMQDLGATDNVLVSGFGVGSPTASTAVPSGVEVAITMSATGSAANMSRFLNRLQNQQARAVLITSVALSNEGAEGDSLSADLALTAFCVQPAKLTAVNNCKASA